MDGYPYSMESAISALAQAGFTHVDLTFCHWCSPGGWMDSRDYLRFADGLGETATRCGVRFNQAHAHFYAHMGTPEENERSENMASREIRRDAFTVAGCMVRIARRLRGGPARFAEMFAEDYTREEVITMFLAMLELAKLNRLHIEQRGAYDEIYLSA